MQVQAYLSFDGRCEEALEFYAKTLGAKVTMMIRVKDSPEAPPPGALPAGSDNKVMPSSFTIGDTVLMATDGHCTGKALFQGVTLSLNCGSPAEAQQRFDALAVGGEVRMPLSKTFFSPSFGMLADRFGVQWMVNVPQPV
jgi:PhnB protein